MGRGVSAASDFSGPFTGDEGLDWRFVGSFTGSDGLGCASSRNLDLRFMSSFLGDAGSCLGSSFFSSSDLGVRGLLLCTALAATWDAIEPFNEWPLEYDPRLSLVGVPANERLEIEPPLSRVGVAAAYASLIADESTSFIWPGATGAPLSVSFRRVDGE